MQKKSGTSYHKKFDNTKKDAPRGKGSEDQKSFRKPKEDRAPRDFDKDNKRSFDRKPFDKSADRPKRTFRKEDTKDGKPYEKREGSFDKKRFEDRPERPKREFSRDEKPRKFDDDKKPFLKKSNDSRTDRYPKTGAKKDDADRSFDKRSAKPFDKFRKPLRADKENNTEKPFKKAFDKSTKPYKKEVGDESKPYQRRTDVKPFDHSKKPFAKSNFENQPSEEKPSKLKFKRPTRVELSEEDLKAGMIPQSKPRRRKEEEEKPIEKAMTLNKYIAHSGECSRRDAAEYVKQGKVKVNGELIIEPGYRVEPGDTVSLLGKKLTPQRGLVYVLLNKPKGFITTTEDPEERKTVMDLVANAGEERLFPIGRLDRNTTGVLLLTNDGSLAHKLSHPSYNIKKIYQVTLNKNLTRGDYEKISKGIELEDGPAPVDAIAYLENRNEVGLEIHNGKNRIVRRIFESLGYEVEKLDRVMYAGLTKKNVARGKWRFLTEREIVLLKHFKE